MTKLISLTTIVLTLVAGQTGSKLLGQKSKPPVTVDIPPHRTITSGFTDAEVAELIRLGAVRRVMEGVETHALPLEVKIPKHIPIAGEEADGDADAFGLQRAEKARLANEAAAAEIIRQQEEDDRKAQQQAADDAEKERQQQEAEARKVAAAAAAKTAEQKAGQQQSGQKAVENAGNGTTKASAARSAGSRKTATAAKTEAEKAADEANGSGEGEGEGADLV